ncbi:3',5'-nucleoside bisphosphate phosphatase [Aromatoleum evansii]|uniref:3',5'-nucleoside bisphosphate phosphatase n=1 Tax=Aromatoleum evansii TaxID=59406 RepID=UPI00145E4DAC|nr:3',5'-nucleoside bisphosphate phosphatase [Aromatoleum evansii]NMG27852.1 PHP domain-containing protein [Aromatoleum evansii]
MFPNADLHCHSTVSDGWLTPAEVVQRAAANGVELLALTDHDEVGGIDEAAAAARECGIALVPGVEISVTFRDETIHVVGLGIDHRNPRLLDGLAQVRSGREQRAQAMSDALDAIGLHGVLEGARRFARNPAMVGRAHFARHIVASGLMPDVGTVFRYYLARGKPGFVPHVWARLEDAVGWIRAAGGIAVIAHPGRYRLSASDMDALFDDFVACGGEALEVVSGAHAAPDVQRFASVARRRGLLASRASDFHGSSESPVDLGRCDPLPPDLVPVWSRLGVPAPVAAGLP